MESTQGNTLLSLQNVQTYLRENAAMLGDVISPRTRATLDALVVELSEHASAQDAHTRGAASALARQRARRSALLRDHMVPIARIARFELAQMPELVSLRLPKGRPSAERLAAIADGMATAAEPWADVFIRAGCKPEFIRNLRIAADEMLQSLHERVQSRAKVRTATSSLRTKLSRARKFVYVIDGFMTSGLANDPDRLAGWKLVSRVPQPRNGSARGAPSAAPETREDDELPNHGNEADAPVSKTGLHQHAEPLMGTLVTPGQLARRGSSISDLVTEVTDVSIDHDQVNRAAPMGRFWRWVVTPERDHRRSACALGDRPRTR